uniref:Uncharacterized protein n=1 Tax=Lactuca sativa TaxID=4236 RepID=A0A9R1UL21_LACSA|nr:hypothetical protein LSAT_V11C800425120 [Lactuca sativa]
MLIRIWYFTNYDLITTVGKLIIISNNCPPMRKYEIKDYDMLAKVGAHHYIGRIGLDINHHTLKDIIITLINFLYQWAFNVDLQTPSEKYFRVSCLSIFFYLGDFDIIKSLLRDNRKNPIKH